MPRLRGLRVLDLFSGIGGFALGLDRAGMETVAFCECEPFARSILARRWPGTPIFEDVRTLTRKALDDKGLPTIDLVCGGFPCQDLSSAGKGRGLAGARSGLWSEYARILGEVLPRFAIIENVPPLRSRGLDRVLSDLHALGFDAEWHCLPACAFGAPHRRDRLWIVAHRDADRWSEELFERSIRRDLVDDDSPQESAHWRGPWARRPGAERYLSDPRARVLRADDGLPHRVDQSRVMALGNAVVPEVAASLGRAINRQRRLAVRGLRDAAIGDAARLWWGDGLGRLAGLGDGSVDAIVADLPSDGRESVIPLGPLWAEYRRVLKPEGAVILTARQPFTTGLINAQPGMFRHSLVCEGWPDDAGGAGRPPRSHADVLVFAEGEATYNPQFTRGRAYRRIGAGRAMDATRPRTAPGRDGSIIRVRNTEGARRWHPRQMPVDLARWLIRAYTNPGELVLDNTMRGGGVGVAAALEGRRFVGIERDPEDFAAALWRVREALGAAA